MSYITDIRNELEYIQEENLDPDFTKENDINKLISFLDILEKKHPEIVKGAEQAISGRLAGQLPLINLPVEMLNHFLPGGLFLEAEELEAVKLYTDDAKHWFFINTENLDIYEPVMDEAGEVTDYKPSDISEVFHVARLCALRKENMSEGSRKEIHRGWEHFFNDMYLSASFFKSAGNVHLENNGIFVDNAGRKLPCNRYSFNAEDRLVLAADLPPVSTVSGNRFSYSFYAEYVSISEENKNGAFFYNFGQGNKNIPLPKYGVICSEIDDNGKILNSVEKDFSELFSDSMCKNVFSRRFDELIACSTNNWAALLQSKKNDCVFALSDLNLADAKDVEAFLNSFPEPGTHISSSAVRECFALLQSEDVFLYMAPSGAIAIPPDGGMFDLTDRNTRATGIFKTPLELEKEFLEHLKACGEYSPAAPVWKELERCIAFYEGRENKDAGKKHRKNSRSYDGPER